MECRRTVIYFSAYRNGVKEEKAGYALLTSQGSACRVEYHCALKDMEQIVPLYCFTGGGMLEGEAFPAECGQAWCVETSAERFLGSEKTAAELEAVCLCGTAEYYCGGRADGQELLWRNGEEEPHPAKVWLDTVTEAVQSDELWEEPVQKEYVPEEIIAEELSPPKTPCTFPELFAILPGLSLPPDGVRQRCCRMELEDLERFPKKWRGLEKNHFLLHGYYQYHHLLLAQLGAGERGRAQYVLGVPGEFYYRDQYMAETFGFSVFYPLKKGNRRRGEFGYWYLYLT